MKYKIDEKETGIDISVTDAKNDKQKLQEAFRRSNMGQTTVDLCIDFHSSTHSLPDIYFVP